MIYILIPVFNESANLVKLSESIDKLDFDVKICIVFVDDASTDNTVFMIHEYFKRFDYHVIQKELNIGPGDSFNRGFEFILTLNNNPNDHIVTIEADNTSDLNILKDMITISSLGYDLVLASVYVQSGGFYKTSKLRLIISYFANLIMRMVFKFRVRTISSFYRVYRAGLIRRIKTEFRQIIEEKGFVSMVEVLLKSILLDIKIIEVPMLLKSKERVGKSKIKIIKTIISYLSFIFHYWNLRPQVNKSERF